MYHISLLWLNLFLNVFHSCHWNNIMLRHIKQTSLWFGLRFVFFAQLFLRYLSPGIGIKPSVDPPKRLQLPRTPSQNSLWNCCLLNLIYIFLHHKHNVLMMIEDRKNKENRHRYHVIILRYFNCEVVPYIYSYENSLLYQMHFPSK